MILLKLQGAIGRCGARGTRVARAVAMGCAASNLQTAEIAEIAAILERAPPGWFDGGKVQLSPHAKSESDEGTGYSSIYYTLQYEGKEKWKSHFASSTSNAGGARGDDLTVKLSHDNRVLIMTTGTWSGRQLTNLKTSYFDVAELVQ